MGMTKTKLGSAIFPSWKKLQVSFQRCLRTFKCHDSDIPFVRENINQGQLLLALQVEGVIQNVIGNGKKAAVIFQEFRAQCPRGYREGNTLGISV